MEGSLDPVGKKKRSPWLYVGIGCGALLLMGIVATVAGVSFLFTQGSQYQKDLANPVVRTEMVKKTLGADTLPDGYHAVLWFSVPTFIETAMLSTRSPDAPRNGQDEDMSLFVYMFLKTTPVAEQEQLRKYLEGQSEDASVLARNGVKLGNGDIIGRGVVPLQDRRVLYVAQRGELTTQQSERKGPGLNSILFLECPGQARLRMGIWMAPDPDPSAPLDKLDLKGTPADPEAIRTFMSHLNPCKES